VAARSVVEGVAAGDGGVWLIQRLGGLSARVSPDPALSLLHRKKNKKLELLTSDREVRARAAYQRKKESIQSPLHRTERRATEAECRAQDPAERGLLTLCSARWRSLSKEQQQGLRTTARRMVAELEMQRMAVELEQINRSLEP
jgi:hypothetical protein